MLKLLTCAQGHYWEKPIDDGADGSADPCPLCGQPAETMPLLDLAPSKVEPATAVEPPAPLPLRDKNGRPIVVGYEILQDLGKGSTGLHLYKARQVLVNRTVVLKVVYAKDDPGQLAWGSLRNEATALGRMTHPNIVQILEAGERERQLFFNAVEYVEGPTLAEALGGKCLPLRQAVALIETLARAVHQAHEKNIVHRSLKPASILLTMQNAECGMQNEKQASLPFCILHSAFCIPKITDFGLARRPVEGDASDVELQGGLPCYLAPEQAWGRAKEIGPATDIYALGAILFELIAGRPPFREATATETLDAIQCREPPPLTRFRSRVPSDLDAICRKCLAKQPRRRYASALDLADDLRRCAAGLPIKARTPGNAERLGKWLRRNGRGVACVVLGLILGITLMGLFATIPQSSSPQDWFQEHSFQPTITQLQGEAMVARGELLEARRAEAAATYYHTLLLAQRAAEEGDAERGQELLDRCPQQLRHWEWHYLRGRLQGGNDSTELSTNFPILCMQLSRDGRYLAVGGGTEAPNNLLDSKGEVSLWDVVRRKRLGHWSTACPVRSVALDLNGTSLAFISAGSRRGMKCTVEARSLQTGKPVFPPRPFAGAIPTSLAYSEYGRYLFVSTEDGKVRQLQADNGFELGAEEIAFPQLRPRGRYSRLVLMPQSAASGPHVSPLPHRLAVVSSDGGQLVLLPDFSLPLRTIALDGRDDSRYLSLAYDPHGDRVAAGTSGRTISLWEVRSSRQPKWVLRGHQGAVVGLSFSYEGQRLASCGADGTVRVWDPGKGLEVLTIKDYPGASGVLFGWVPGGGPGGIGVVDALAIAHENTVSLILASPVAGEPRR